jgi:hypothetical protein
MLPGDFRVSEGHGHPVVKRIAMLKVKVLIIKKFDAKWTLEFHASFYFFPTNHSRF